MSGFNSNDASITSASNVPSCGHTDSSSNEKNDSNGSSFVSPSPSPQSNVNTSDSTAAAAAAAAEAATNKTPSSSSSHIHNSNDNSNGNNLAMTNASTSTVTATATTTTAPAALTLPRASPWATLASNLAATTTEATTSASASATSAASQRMSLRTIMEQEEQTKQHQKQQELQRQAQAQAQLDEEEEMIRLAMAASLQEDSSSSARAHAHAHAQANHNHNPHLTDEEMRQIQQALGETNFGDDDETSNNIASPPAATDSMDTDAKVPAVAASASVSAAASANNNIDNNNNDNVDGTVNWKEAAQFLSPQELEQIQQALALATVAAKEETTRSTTKNITGSALSATELEAQSLQLAWQMAQEEQNEQQQNLKTKASSARRTPQGHVRVMTRAELLAQQQEQDELYYNNHDDHHLLHGDEDFHVTEQQQLQQGFRMNANTSNADGGAPPLWTRLDAHTVIGPNGDVRTKHDTTLQAQSNAHRLALDVGAGGVLKGRASSISISSSKVGNKAFNAFHQSMKTRTTRKGVAASGTGRAGSDADGTKGGAMDARVRQHVNKSINNGIISKLNGAVKEGKEAIVYHAEPGTESEGFDVAVKIFKRIIEFKQRGDYVDGDPRYLSANFRKSGTRQQLEMWTEKEYRNLVRASRAGVPAPTPLHYKENILWMRFLGENGWPAPQLRELDLRKGSKRWNTLYTQVMEAVHLLYSKARLVHGDLSEYNILAVPSNLVQNKLVTSGEDENGQTDEATASQMQAVLIDFGQSVDTRHPSAMDLLKRDLDRVNAFFSKQGVAIQTLDEALQFCTEPISDGNDDDDNDSDGREADDINTSIDKNDEPILMCDGDGSNTAPADT